MKTLTPQHLDRLFSLAKMNYVEDARGDLDDHQFQAQCWVKAVLTILDKSGEVIIKTTRTKEKT